MAISLGFITEQLGGELFGDPSVEIEGLAPLQSAGSGELSFLGDSRHAVHLSTCQASCVVVGPDMKEAALLRGNAKDRYAIYAQAVQNGVMTRNSGVEYTVHKPVRAFIQLPSLIPRQQ